MNHNLKTAVVGCGHIGTHACAAVERSSDQKLVGIIERGCRVDEVRHLYPGTPVCEDVFDLPEKPDVAILCVPTRAVEQEAARLLAAEIRTVDCFDMHGDAFLHLKETLDQICMQSGSAALMGSGVDPGISTMVRALFEIWAPTGITYVEYGPGMSMGHTVAAKAYPGVKDALSITRPGSPGCHNRDLYLVLEDGANLDEVKSAILADSYFCHDSVRVFQVSDVTNMIDMGHRIHVSRKGGASGIDNQLLNFDTTFHNPASTAQVLVSSARAVMCLPPGAHSMLEVPLIHFLPEDLKSLMKRIV